MTDFLRDPFAFTRRNGETTTVKPANRVGAAAGGSLNPSPPPAGDAAPAFPPGTEITMPDTHISLAPQQFDFAVAEAKMNEEIEHGVELSEAGADEDAVVMPFYRRGWAIEDQIIAAEPRSAADAIIKLRLLADQMEHSVSADLNAGLSQTLEFIEKTLPGIPTRGSLAEMVVKLGSLGDRRGAEVERITVPIHLAAEANDDELATMRALAVELGDASEVDTDAAGV